MLTAYQQQTGVSKKTSFFVEDLLLKRPRNSKKSMKRFFWKGTWFFLNPFQFSRVSFNFFANKNPVLRTKTPYSQQRSNTSNARSNPDFRFLDFEVFLCFWAYVSCQCVNSCAIQLKSPKRKTQSTRSLVVNGEMVVAPLSGCGFGLLKCEIWRFPERNCSWTRTLVCCMWTPVQRHTCVPFMQLYYLIEYMAVNFSKFPTMQLYYILEYAQAWMDGFACLTGWVFTIVFSVCLICRIVLAQMPFGALLVGCLCYLVSYSNVAWEVLCQ